MTAVRTLNSPPDSNVKPSEILKVANSFWERVQPEKMANAAHLDFPIIFKVITLDSHHGIATLLSEVRFVTAVTAGGSVIFFRISSTQISGSLICMFSSQKLMKFYNLAQL